MDDRQHVPANGIVADQVPEELRNVAEFVRFITMDGIVVLGEGRLEEIRPKTVDFCEPLSNQTVKFGVGSFLGATFNDH